MRRHSRLKLALESAEVFLSPEVADKTLTGDPQVIPAGNHLRFAIPEIEQTHGLRPILEILDPDGKSATIEDSRGLLPQRILVYSYDLVVGQ